MITQFSGRMGLDARDLERELAAMTRDDARREEKEEARERLDHSLRLGTRLRVRRPGAPGGILVGIGLGILLGDFFAWLLIGIGAGFILMGFIAALARR